MPFVPKALASFEGRVYAFEANKMLRINPEGLFVEDEHLGAGTHISTGVLSTAYGLFFVNEENIFVYDGRQVIPIGEKNKRCVGV